MGFPNTIIIPLFPLVFQEYQKYKGIALTIPLYTTFLGHHLGRNKRPSCITNLSVVGIVLRIATCDAKFSAPKKKGSSKTTPFLLFPLKFEFVNSNTF